MGKTARDVMTQGVECAGENEAVVDAAKKLADLNVGAMPIVARRAISETRRS